MRRSKTGRLDYPLEQTRLLCVQKKKTIADVAVLADAPSSGCTFEFGLLFLVLPGKETFFYFHSHLANAGI